MTHSQFLKEIKLTKDQLAKIKMGICPNCKTELIVGTEMHHHERSRLCYNQDKKQWDERAWGKSIFRKRITQIECTECSSQFDPDFLQDEIQLNVMK